VFCYIIFWGTKVSGKLRAAFVVAAARGRRFTFHSRLAGTDPANRNKYLDPVGNVTQTSRSSCAWIILIWNSFNDASNSSTEWATSRFAPAVDHWVYSGGGFPVHPGPFILTHISVVFGKPWWCIRIGYYCFCGLPSRFIVYNNPDIIHSTLRNFRCWHITAKRRNHSMLQGFPLNVRSHTYVEEIKLSLYLGCSSPCSQKGGI